MKKIILICALLLASLIIFTACNESSSPCDVHTDANSDGVCDVCREGVTLDCTTHTDADSDGKCDACGEEVAAPAVIVDYTITVVDQDGNKIESASFTIYAGFDQAANGTTDAEGSFSLKLVEGEYTLSFDSLPEGYFPYEASSAINVSTEITTAEILVENVIPNGSAERPFPISIENPSVTLPASASYYYSIGGGTRILKLEAAGIELVYGNNTYLPDVNGKIELTLIPESHFTPIILKFTNKAESEQTIDLTFESLPGSPELPFEAKLDTTYTASVAKENTVYYQWIADKSGIIAVTTYTADSTIMLYNKTTMEVSPYTDGKVCEYIWVNAGDELSVAVASTSKEDNASVEFLLTYAKGDADLPIILLDDSATFSIPVGKKYSFVSLLLGADTLNIKNKSVKIEINGVELDKDENGSVEYVFSAGDVITLTNVTDERCDVTIKLSSSDK